MLERRPPGEMTSFDTRKKVSVYRFIGKKLTIFDFV